MRSILVAVVAVLVVGCGGPSPVESDATERAGVAPAAPAFAPSWHFTAKDVSGSFTVTASPQPGPLGAPDLLTLTGTGTVGGVAGAVSGNEVPSNGGFRVYIALPNFRIIRIDGQIDATTGATFSGSVLDTGGFPATVDGRTNYNESVTGTSP